MSSNRFTKTNQMSEAAFVGLVYDYLIGIPVAVSARRVGVKRDTADEKFQEFGARLETDKSICPLLTDLPEENDVVWSALYDCVFKCKDVRELGIKEIKDFPSAYSENLKPTLKKLTWNKPISSDGCSVCPLEKGHSIPDPVIEKLFYFKAMSRGMRRDKFRSVFLRSVIVQGILTNRTTENASLNSVAKALLISFQKNPV